MSNLKGKTVLLTGASGGFGQQFMRQLLRRNCKLIVTDLAFEPLQAAAVNLHAEVGSGELIACVVSDLSTQAGVEALWDEVLGFGRNIDILINNAGIGLMGRHDEVPANAWERLLEINLRAPMRLTALAMPQMIARRSGHIVNVGSVASWTSDLGLSAYAASKYGLRGFSEALADELRPHNVRVSAIYPFYSNTAIIDSPQYGSLARNRDTIDRSQMTDPAKVIAQAVKAMEAGELHIFPDRIGRIIYHFKRYAPSLFELVKRRVSVRRAE